MKYTTNKNLKLPEYTDVVDVADLNENFEAIDEHLGETVASENGAHGFRYDEENQKLEAKTSTGEWEEISLGADVSGVTATADKVLKGSKFVTADGVLTDGAMMDFSTILESITVSSLQDDGEKLITPRPMVFRGYLGDAKILADYETITSAINLTSDKIAEGETILGVTGTHAGGLKVVTGSVSNFSISTGLSRNITISNHGIVTKYAIVNFKANGNQVSHGYDLTTSNHLIPELNAAQMTAYMHSYTNKGYVYYNNTTTLTFTLFYTASYSGTSYYVSDISYILIGE